MKIRIVKRKTGEGEMRKKKNRQKNLTQRQ